MSNLRVLDDLDTRLSDSVFRSWERRVANVVEQLTEPDISEFVSNLRAVVAAHHGERDGLQTQFDQFRKGIKTLLGQVEPPLAGSQPVTSAAAPPAAGKS